MSNMNSSPLSNIRPNKAPPQTGIKKHSSRRRSEDNNDASASANSRGQPITNHISHDPDLPAHSTRKLKTGLVPEKKKLFWGTKKEDGKNLNMMVKDNSTVMLLENPKSKGRNVGELNEMSSDAGFSIMTGKLKTGLVPEEQELFRGTKKEDGENLNMMVKDNSTVMLLEDPKSKERNVGELNEMSSDAGFSIMTGKLKTGLVPEEKELFRGTKKEDGENLNMMVKDNSTVMLLEDPKSKERNVGELNEMSSDAGFSIMTGKLKTGLVPEEQELFRGTKKEDGENLNMMVKDNSTVMLLEDLKSKERNVGELNETSSDAGVVGVETNEMSAIAGVSAEVDRLSDRVVALQAVVSCGTKVSNKEFTVSTELLIRQLLKLDNIEAEGEARVHRKDEVRRVQDLMDTLDTLKARNSDLSKNNSNDMTSQNNNSVRSQNSNDVASQNGNVDSGVDGLSTPTAVPSSTEVSHDCEMSDL